MTSTKFSTWTFIILFLLSLILVVHLLFNFITPMIIALVLVSICGPIHNRLKKTFNKSDHWPAFFSTCLVFLMVMIPLGLFILAVTKEAIKIYRISINFSDSPEFSLWISTIKSNLSFWQKVLADFGYSFSLENALNTIISFVHTLGQRIYETMSVIVINIASISLKFVLTFLLVYVFFMNGSSIREFVMNIIPLSTKEKEAIAVRFRELSKAIFLGNGLISILEGIIGGILFFLFGIPGSAIFGFSMTITAFLPLIGSSIIVVPATLYLYFQDRPIAAFFFLALNTIQLGILEMLVKPKFIGQKTDMHAVLVFLSIIAGIQVYGIFGLFYGPLLVTMFLSLSQMYKEHYRDMLVK